MKDSWSWSVTALGLAACTFDPTGVGAPDAFVDPGDDGGGLAQVWRDDTADDFKRDTAVLDGAVVEPWGAIGPRAWLTGALVVRGSNDQLFVGLDGDEWSSVEAATPSGLGVISSLLGKWGLDRPRSLGITSSDTWTLWMEGEVWLEAGAHLLSLRADDEGFVELAEPGSADYTRVVAADYTDVDPVNGAYEAYVDGWYPVRIAISEGVADSMLELGLDGEPLPADRLRVAAEQLDPGLYWTGYDDSRLLAPIGPWLFRREAFDYAPSGGEITDLGFSESDRFAMRWSGQVRVDVAGAYGLRLDTDDGQRLWVDGAVVLDYWTDEHEDHVAQPITLDVGWHDVVVDLNENAGGQRVELSIDTGPELAGERWPVERLRAVRPRHERTTGRLLTSGGSIPDAGAITLQLPLTADAGALANATEVGATITHSAWKQLEIVLVSPDGSEYVALEGGASELTGTHTLRVTVPTPGEEVDGTWRLRVTDAAQFDLGMVTSAAITVRHGGGAAPIAPVAVYESELRDLGGVVGFDAVRWSGRLPSGTSARVSLRTCDEPAACAAAEWSEPVTVSGATPAVEGARYAQYRVELVSDGDKTPSVDAVEIEYRAAD